MSTFQSAEDVRVYLGCHPVVARLLWHRGFTDSQELEQFLRPQLSQLPDPFVLFDLNKAVQRVALALERKETIVVYGDYDVDGTCGAAILCDFFRQIGVEPVRFQPNRFTDGYGVHVHSIEALIEQHKPGVILTVDCGITAVAPAEAAKKHGADMIVLDHHKPGAQFPDAAFAVVDPHRTEDTSGLKNLCGAGIAFFFIIAMRSVLREKGFFQTVAEPNLLKFLDLVAIATVADMVDVRGVNRVLVSYGLKVMEKSPRPGVKAILDAAQIKKPVATHCGFILGPRINAAGRLKSARSALDLLLSTQADEAKSFAEELETLNEQRKKAQEKVTEEALAQAEAHVQDPMWAKLAEQTPAAQFGPWPRAVVLYSEHWHEGVVGIVASKVVEKYARPVIVLARKETADSTELVIKGSVRSVPKVDILAAISADSVKEHLLNFGGHAHAGGVTLKGSELDAFRAALNVQLALTTVQEHFQRDRVFDTEIDLSEIDERLMAELDLLEPFGQKFPEPVFKLRQPKIAEVKVLKEKHLKLRFESQGAKVKDGIWFQSAQFEEGLRSGQLQEFWVSPQWNEWQGTKKVQLKVFHAQ